MRATLPEFKVRAITRTDREQWAPLWRAYLTFYQAAESAEVTSATWARIFDPLEPVHALVAERDDWLIGFSHFLFQRSTWLLNPQCYLQDLYVGEDKRGCGVGRALIAAVVGAAKEAGATRVFWNTHETNAVAQALRRCGRPHRLHSVPHRAAGLTARASKSRRRPALAAERNFP